MSDETTAPAELRLVELPTHVEELDAMRLQIAKLRSEAAIRAAHDAAEVANKALETIAELYVELKEKYAIGDGADEGINLETLEIKRA